MKEDKKIVPPTAAQIKKYGYDPEKDPLSLILARTDTKVGRAITDVAVAVFKKPRHYDR